jgi:esterase/lipase superfamily enzyme
VPNPAKHFAVVSSERVDEKRLLVEVGASAARGEALGPYVGIFIHGFNNSFQESLFRMARPIILPERRTVATVIAAAAPSARLSRLHLTRY